ncbi:U1 small nuclear ribonucleoprotein 70 kDa [Heracleum sosnowskyi]|uniref:U1 small nuclear ribonucleoprotein 70 kDa n=1 Tax=Heracleum sosnowskyi TaxID=360622 RepID=A0AAD8H0S6_9APIA|nr:U1 small nuclear ribonucleoprotein 70 kDa [Heracleum sosnowskyi]
MGDDNNAYMRNNNNNGANVQGRVKTQNRTNAQQLKAIGSIHPTGLTSNLLRLFEPRPPLEYKPPLEKNKCPPYTGMAQYVQNFAERSHPDYALPMEKSETPAQRRVRIHKVRLEAGAKKATEELEKYDPSNDPNVSGDPYKTLFVARLNYETTESRIKREFEAYGPIKQVRLVADKETNKPRGYAFVEYMHKRDMKAAYKQADGKKLDNRRVLVDVERGRTVPNWRPRRLGGGLGTTRVGAEEVNQRYSGRAQHQSAGPPRSEEPRVRDDRERDREKSRERSKDRGREHEKSHERSHDRHKDRDYRDDRHHRDRERTRERDVGRDRTRDRDRGRERGRDRGRDKGRDRYREKNRGRDDELIEDHGHSHDKDYDHDCSGSKLKRDRHGESGKSYDRRVEAEDDPGWSERVEQGHRGPEFEQENVPNVYYEHGQSRGNYNPDGKDVYSRYEHHSYDQMEEDNFAYNGAKTDLHKDRDYRGPDMSLYD